MRDFSWTLARLLAMNGTPVHVSVADADAEHAVLAAFGGILNTTPAIVDHTDGNELVILSFDHVIDRARIGTIFIHRSRFRDAEREDDGCLRVWVGSQLLCLEPLGDTGAMRPPVAEREEQLPELGEWP